MIWISAGILMLAIATLMKAYRDSEHQMREAYSEGFRLGAETVIEQKYQTLEAFEKENGLTSVAAESVR
jgi:hypothetical protein